MAREDLHFRLRIPEKLKNQIEEKAEVNERSMTAEIVARLEDSFETDKLIQRLNVDLEHHKIREEVLHREVARHKHDAETHNNLFKEYEALYERTARELDESKAELRDAKKELEKRNEAEATAVKFQSLMQQARYRLSVVRSERDKLAAYIKALSDGVEKQGIMEETKINELDDRSLLLKIYFETMRLNSELVFQRQKLEDEDALIEPIE